MAFCAYLYHRYHVDTKMVVKVQEYTKNQYPDNPGTLSSQYGNYSHPKLLLENEGGSHFTFTFMPPGIYRKDKPWSNEFWRINKPIKAEFNDILSPANPNQKLQELVIHYEGDDHKKSSFYISGFDLTKLPHLEVDDYAKGTFYLMGIGTAPLKEKYSSLINNPPEKSSIFSVLVNEKNEWINHHEVAIDGSILFVDKNNSNRLHILLVSYERHAVVAHNWVDLTS